MKVALGLVVLCCFIGGIVVAGCGCQGTVKDCCCKHKYVIKAKVINDGKDVGGAVKYRIKEKMDFKKEPDLIEYGKVCIHGSVVNIHHQHNRTMRKLSQAFSYSLAGTLIAECQEDYFAYHPRFSRNIVPRADGEPRVCASKFRFVLVPDDCDRTLHSGTVYLFMGKKKTKKVMKVPATGGLGFIKKWEFLSPGQIAFLNDNCQ